MAVELNISLVPLGSTTFRDPAREKGLEPDGCYYIRNAAAAREMEEAFDPAVHPPPDLAVEVDITRRSVARQPVYAALGVPELWRFDGQRLAILVLQPSGTYAERDTSVAFPFLPMDEFRRFLDAARQRDEVAVLREFQQWVRQLPA